MSTQNHEFPIKFQDWFSMVLDWLLMVNRILKPRSISLNRCIQGGRSAGMIMRPFFYSLGGTASYLAPPSSPENRDFE